MYRLDEQSRKFLLSVVNYTPEEREIISRVKTGMLGIFRIQFPDPFLYGSERGISEQLDDFDTKTGFIFYWIVVNGVADLEKRAVHLV